MNEQDCQPSAIGTVGFRFMRPVRSLSSCRSSWLRHAYADHQRQEAIERITDLLEQLHEDNLEDERSELDGCRDAIDKATSILLDQGRIGPSLGLDTSSYAISTAIERAKRRLMKWQDALAKLPDGPVELGALTKSFPGVNEEGGTFRTHLELARLAIALKARLTSRSRSNEAATDRSWCSPRSLPDQTPQATRLRP